MESKEIDDTERFMKAIKKLSKSIDDASTASGKLQRWLIFWTAVMSLGVVLQAIILIKQYF